MYQTCSPEKGMQGWEGRGGREVASTCPWERCDGFTKGSWGGHAGIICEGQFLMSPCTMPKICSCFHMKWEPLEGFQ